MTYWETIHTFKTARLTIETAVTPEDYAPDFDFEDDASRDDFFEQINRGELAWFQARVRVLLDHKFEVGADYVGGCCYKNSDEFLHDSYWHDIVTTACERAREYLTKYQTPLIVRAA
jgi:hypothetical protein